MVDYGKLFWKKLVIRKLFGEYGIKVKGGEMVLKDILFKLL